MKTQNTPTVRASISFPPDVYETLEVIAKEKKVSLRQEQSAPVLAELREKFFDWKEQLLPKHPMAEAIGSHHPLAHRW